MTRPWALKIWIVALVLLWKFFVRQGEPEVAETQRYDPPNSPTPFESFRVPWEWIVLFLVLAAVAWLWTEDLWRFL